MSASDAMPRPPASASTSSKGPARRFAFFVVTCAMLRAWAPLDSFLPKIVHQYPRSPTTQASAAAFGSSSRANRRPSASTTSTGPNRPQAAASGRSLVRGAALPISSSWPPRCAHSSWPSPIEAVV